MNPVAIILALGLIAAGAESARASSPDAWAELFKRASAACAKASELKKVRTGKPVDFSDKVLVIVDGIWPQPHMKNAPARFACLYDKRARTAEAAELPR
jgi:hypothetical protein